MNKEMDLYSDYLLSSFGQVTATGLSNLLDNSVSHDKITRMLSGKEYNSKDLLNHFALKAKVYLVALEVAWEQFDYLKNY